MTTRCRWRKPDQWWVRTAHAVLLLTIVVVSGERQAVAQTIRSVGLVLGIPTSLGVVWHVTDGVAVRPELSLSGSMTETRMPAANGSVLSSNDSWQVGAGASLLLFVHQLGAIRTYVSPRFIYVRSDTTTDSGTSATTTYSGSGSFGVQLALHRRMSVYGELGLSYTRLSTDSVFVSTTTSRGTVLRSRSTLGLVMYF